MEFNFNSRETYLAYKEEWKKRYTLRSQIQRQLKTAIKEDMRNNGYATEAHINYERGVARANELLSERRASKGEAARQWKEAHLKVA